MYSLRSKSVPGSAPAGRFRKHWRMRGIVRRAPAPSCAGWQGTSRQPSVATPSEAASWSKMRQTFCAPTSSSGKKNIPTP